MYIRYHTNKNRHNHKLLKISNAITQETAAKTPKDIANILSDGHSVVLGVMDGERNKSNLISQQIMMLDFDNTKIVDGVKVKDTEHYVVMDDILNSPGWTNTQHLCTSRSVTRMSGNGLGWLFF